MRRLVRALVRAGHRLAQAHGPPGAQAGAELQLAAREQRDHRRAEREAAHFVALGEGGRPGRRSATRARSPARGGVTTPCHTVAMLPTMVAPTGRATNGVPRADSNTDDALVALREQPGHAARGGRVDREQCAGTWIMRRKSSIAGHMDAVVVLRAQVQRREEAVIERGGQRCIAADEGRRRVAMALGLQDLVVLRYGQLADCAVHRADEIGRRERARAGTAALA